MSSIAKWYNERMIPMREAWAAWSIKLSVFMMTVGATLSAAIEMLQMLDMQQQSEILVSLLGPKGPAIVAISGFLFNVFRRVRQNLDFGNKPSSTAASSSD